MSVKKKPTVQRTAKAKVKAEVSVSVQTAAERKAAEAQLRALIDQFSPTQLRLISAIRRSLRKRLPTAHEVVYEYRDSFVISFSPSSHGYEGIFAVRGSADGVKLFFNRGKELPDPEKLLKGAGTMARSINVEAASTLTRPAVVSLIDTAIAHNPVPFESEGLGSVVVRLTTATKRRQGSKA